MEVKARTEALAGEQVDGVGWRGLGTAVGCTTGIARIVPNLADIGRVQKGDILITNSTDPGWAPVFSISSHSLADGMIFKRAEMMGVTRC